MALFTASSVACGVSDSQALLIAGRFAQGIGGALSSSVIIAIVVTEFPEARERAKAMSAYIFVAVGGGSIGLLVGGVLTQALNWHWIFFINVPIGVVTFVFGRILIEENDGPGLRAGLDVLGVNPGHGGVDGRHLCHHQATGYDWASDRTLGLGGVAVLLLCCLRGHGGQTGEPDHAAAYSAHPDPDQLQHHPWFSGHRSVRDVLPRGPLSRERVGLQPHTDRSRLPALLGDDGPAFGRGDRPSDWGQACRPFRSSPSPGPVCPPPTPAWARGSSMSPCRCRPPSVSPYSGPSPPTTVRRWWLRLTRSPMPR